MHPPSLREVLLILFPVDRVIQDVRGNVFIIPPVTDHVFIIIAPSTPHGVEAADCGFPYGDDVTPPRQVPDAPGI